MTRGAILGTLGAVLIGLLLPELAVAQAGGGSGGFGGGGGGGGFGGGGGGGGFGGGGTNGRGSGGGAFSFVLIALVFLVIFVVGAIAAWRENRRRQARRELVHAAAAEAAEDDAYLAYDAVLQDSQALYMAVQEAWDAGDSHRLGELVGPDLMVEWSRRLADFRSRGWHSRVRVLDPPAIDYVGLVNREDDSEDRVTVLVEARLAAYVETGAGQRMYRDGQTDEFCTVSEYWTLARRGDGWIVLSIEQGAEGAHNLEDAIVAMPESDTERIRGQAVTELASAEAVPEGFTTADLAVLDFQGSAREEALDLSLADGRFAPDVLEVAARRAVAAWAEAVDGDDAALGAVATPGALHQLLYGSDTSGSTRLVVRGPRVRRITVAGVDASATPAQMAIDIEVSATRYVEDRDTTDVLSGSKSGPRSFSEHWKLALDGPADSPWRVVSAEVA